MQSGVDGGGGGGGGHLPPGARGWLQEETLKSPLYGDFNLVDILGICTI